MIIKSAPKCLPEEAASFESVATPGAGKRIALTPKVVLVVQDWGDQTVDEELTSEYVDAFNLMTYRCADRFVIGTSEEQLRSLGYL